MYQHHTYGVMLIEGHSIICFAKSKYFYRQIFIGRIEVIQMQRIFYEKGLYIELTLGEPYTVKNKLF
jgi:hypothetical protein